MTHLEWTDPAVSDLENIRDYVAKDSTEYARALVERLILSVERIKSFPQSGRLVPEASSAKVCEVLVSGYRVIYRVRRDRTQILAVVHSARNLAGMHPKPWYAA